MLIEMKMILLEVLLDLYLAEILEEEQIMDSEDEVIEVNLEEEGEEEIEDSGEEIEDSEEEIEDSEEEIEVEVEVEEEEIIEEEEI